jgi:hypothetical protein
VNLYDAGLLLDSRVVDVLRLSNLILVTLASLKPFFFNGLKEALHFSDNVGASDPPESNKSVQRNDKSHVDCTQRQ